MQSKKQVALFLALISLQASMGLEATFAFFQTRIENEKVFVGLGGGEKGPAVEIIRWMEAAKVPKTVSAEGDPTYTLAPMWAFSQTLASKTSHAFFTRIPLSETSWSLTTLTLEDQSVTPFVKVQGTELFLDNESSRLLYETMEKAGLKAEQTMHTTTYSGEWSSCEMRKFNPAKPFWVCVIRNYKW